jgi:probable F420-dependent oxidoreductase
VRFGVQHAVGDPKWVPGILEPTAVRPFVRAAEDGGFGAIGFTDHPSPSANWIERDGEGVADPIAALGFCAGITDRIRLLTWLLILPYHNPFHAAYQVATLDALSGGRVTLGLGTGYLRSELYAAGADPSTRLAEFDARLAVMREAWMGATVDASGAGYSARGVRVLPPVVQQPHPPIWIHGNSPWGTRRAARDAQGWIAMLGSGPIFETIRTVPIPDIEALKARIDDLRVEIDRAGRSIEDVEIVVTGKWGYLDARKGWDTDACLAEVAELEELGADWIVVTVCGDDAGAAEDTVRRFGEEIVTVTADNTVDGRAGSER